MMSRVTVSKRQPDESKARHGNLAPPFKPKKPKDKKPKETKASKPLGDSYDIIGEIISHDPDKFVMDIVNTLGVEKQQTEGGVHVHLLDRENETTEIGGTHTHVFAMPDGMLIETENDGAHAHLLFKDDVDMVEWGGRHTHRVKMPDGTELLTEADGSHGHELQVTETAISGLHNHALALPGEMVIESLSPGQFWEHVTQMKALEKRIVLRDDEYCAVSEDGERSFGCFPTRAEAAERLRQVEAAAAAKKQAPREGMDREALDNARKARSRNFGVEVVERSSLTFSSGKPTTLSDYADPVNLKFPIDTVARARNARTRFKQFASNYGESKSRRVVHTRIVRRQLTLGIKPGIDKDDALDMLLPASLRDRAQKAVEKSFPMSFPAVLVEGGDMPAAGSSGLPLSLERVIPEPFRYWERTDKEAREIRDALIASDFFTEKNVRPIDIDGEMELRRVEVRMFLYEPEEDDKAPEPYLSKFQEFITSQPRESKFTLSQQIWKGDRISRKIWHLVLDDPRGGVDSWELLVDPAVCETQTAKFTKRDEKSLLTLAGPISIGKDLNGTRSIPSTIEILDQGIAEVSYGGSALKKVCFRGGLLKGMHTLVAEEAGSRIWEMTHVVTSDFSLLVKRFGKIEEPGDLVDVFNPVNAVSESAMSDIRRRLNDDDEQRMAVGIVLEPEVEDAQEDIYSVDEVERAAVDYMKSHERIKLMHDGDAINDRVTLLGSYLAKEDFSLGDETVAKGSWIAVLFVPDVELWESLKSGALGGLSIGGSAIRRPDES